MSKLSPVSYKQLVRVLKPTVFATSAPRAITLVFTKSGVIRPVVIPKYAAVPVFIIKNNLRTAGMSRDRYFELLTR